MSALAQILQSRGTTVSGSDLTESEQTLLLRKKGIKISIGHNVRNIPKNCTRVVVNGAIEETNPELLGARKRGIEIVSREELLAEIESTFKIRIAVAGTHGKSTTTAMISAILLAAGLEPTVHNGAVMNGVGSNLVLGGPDIFLTEACEFKRAFLRLAPTIAVITNIDADHLDCYHDLNEIKDVFNQFASRAKHVIQGVPSKDGTRLSEYFCEFKNARNNTARSLAAPAVTNQFSAINIIQHKNGTHTFTFANRGKPVFDITLNVVGRHNIQNAIAAAAVGLHLKIPPKKISAALSAYSGVGRRFELLRSIKDCQIIADYAHHPNALVTTIATAHSLYKRFLIVFQPHTYTRTLALFGDFVRVLKTCECVLYKTYAAREKPIAGGTAGDLAAALEKKFLRTGAELQKFILDNHSKYDAIILTGAGDMMYHL